MQNLADSVNSLPVALQIKVFEYIDELTRNKKKKRNKLRLRWAGGLKEYKNQFTSVELQKKSLEWWTH